MKQQENDRLRFMLQNPMVKQAYADKYDIPVDSVSIDQDGIDAFGTQKKLPDSIFTDFNKPESEMTAGYDMMHPLFDQRDTKNTNPFFDEEY